MRLSLGPQMTPKRGVKVLACDTTPDFLLARVKSDPALRCARRGAPFGLPAMTAPKVDVIDASAVDSRTLGGRLTRPPLPIGNRGHRRGRERHPGIMPGEHILRGR